MRQASKNGERVSRMKSFGGLRTRPGSAQSSHVDVAFDRALLFAIGGSMKKWWWLLIGLISSLGPVWVARAHDALSDELVFQAQGFTGGGPSNLFPQAQGAYNGLIVSSNLFVPEQSGYFRIAVGPTGKFSGKMNVGNTVTSWSSHFNQQGQAGFYIYRRQTVWEGLTYHYRYSLSWHITLALTADSDRIEGVVENVRYGWATELS